VGLLLVLPAYAVAGNGLSERLLDKANPLNLFKDFTGSSAGENQFLEPDQAFKVTVDPAGPDALVARFQIADRYYLYHDKFSFKLDGEGVRLGTVTVPHGVIKDDPNFGKTEIMHGAFAVRLPLIRSRPGAQDVNLTLGYQGCAEEGICYPPIKKTLPIELAAATGPAADTGNTGPAAVSGGGTPAPAVSETDRITQLLRGGVSPLLLASFFGFGLLLAFTPCVFPMVPILSGIIVGHGASMTTRRALGLSVVYVLAMALTYALAGVAAALLGRNLQAAFQQPAVLIAFAAVFVALAFSMFGFFDLQLPSALQSRLASVSHHQRAGTVHGVAIMGVLSAIIVGPCVAPPLAGALVYIGQSGNAWLGGTALFVLALGMGAPLLLVGASAGSLLPRAGAWMEAVKKFFGFVMLGVALWFLERVFPGPIIMALWAILILVGGVFLGAFDRMEAASSGWRRVGKGLGLALTLYGAALIVGAAAGGSDLARPLGALNLTGTREPAAPALHFLPVRGHDGLQQALAKARGRPVMLDFYADWCVECKQFERETLADPRVRRDLSRAVLLRADVTANDDTDQALLKEFGLFGPPAILFFDATGRERRGQRLQGFVPPQPFLAHLRIALNP
jgi:thiol:disulfide interchange protein DsbD